MAKSGWCEDRPSVPKILVEHQNGVHLLELIPIHLRRPNPSSNNRVGEIATESQQGVIAAFVAEKHAIGLDQ